MKTNIKEICENVYMLSIPLLYHDMQVSVCICIHDKNLTLIDTGPHFGGTLSEIEESLKFLGYTLKDIDRILITHYHTDHSGLASQIKKQSGASVQMSDICSENIRTIAMDFRIELLRKFSLQQGLGEKTMNTIMNFFNSLRTAIEPVKADKILQSNEIIKIGNHELKVISTPGHTRGHICFHITKQKILLSGDHILPDITPNLSPDLVKPNYRPLKNYLRSLEKIKDLPVDIVYPGHGEPFREFKNRVEETQEHHRVRKDLIFKSVENGTTTAMEVALTIFGNELKLFDKYLALHETYVHLIELEDESLIQRHTKDGIDFFSAI